MANIPSEWRLFLRNKEAFQSGSQKKDVDGGSIKKTEGTLSSGMNDKFLCKTQ